MSRVQSYVRRGVSGLAVALMTFSLGAALVPTASAADTARSSSAAVGRVLTAAKLGAAGKVSAAAPSCKLTIKEDSSNSDPYYAMVPVGYFDLQTVNGNFADCGSSSVSSVTGTAAWYNEKGQAVSGTSSSVTYSEYIGWSLKLKDLTLDSSRISLVGHKVHYKVSVTVKNSRGSQSLSFTGKSHLVTAEQKTVEIYRLYNPNSGEHFYTSNSKEADRIILAGWNFEGASWNAPLKSTKPVYRLFNPNTRGAGSHYYTESKGEGNSLVRVGWKWDNGSKPVFYSNAVSGTMQKVYVTYNPHNGGHNYTTSNKEASNLIKIGWKYKTVALYGVPDFYSGFKYGVTIS